MILKLLVVGLLMSVSFAGHSQNLFSERIWKLIGRKRAVYLEKGIFHNGKKETPSMLLALRHSFTDGKERIVLDFNTNKLPRIYGHISKDKKKLFLDMFKTRISTKLKSFGNGKFVKSVDFYPITGKQLSAELSLSISPKTDIFYLENPARLVIDIKSN